jgi:hypothetical protein
MARCFVVIALFSSGGRAFRATSVAGCNPSRKHNNFKENEEILFFKNCKTSVNKKIFYLIYKYFSVIFEK